ncbi:hypothetical protein [Nevskia ramosa]|uniref:hypothetical protein n=1 Tax=Nevskia ramosa TaxID=64002 RepID=UPI0003B4EA77|nr:hypothetical protein [Nevskia ramosa]
MSSMYTRHATKQAGLLMVALSSLAAGCSTTSYCSGPQPYESAASITPIVAPEGMRIPTPSTALKVPEAKTESVTYGFYAPDPAKPGKKRMFCLDQPPALTQQAEAAPAAVVVPAAAAVAPAAAAEKSP